MLLRSSITSTKKFFQKTLKNFKSFFSSEYQRLPKSTSPHNHLSYYVAAKHVMNMDKGESSSSSSTKQKQEHENNKNNEKRLTLQRGKQKDSKFIDVDMKERRNCFVEEKLKELEMLDMDNVDYVMDIEEVLHYYSRLTCPVYVEIVDKFFMEMYSELFVL
ncbi:uncharacterized protein [Cicer arietinum]|uniref:Uncharacterized protein LOC101490134 n=1 Tax=Cicer arietinum TaxID=3827 RepID=A0A1S2Z0T4_CICAR|nr:uncharacterized protein LOC101490134 [Cicer arietinum]